MLVVSRDRQVREVSDHPGDPFLRGNATDLSLLPTMDYTDIQALQSVGEAAQAANKAFILRNDSKAVWEFVKSLKNARLDIVLDNCELLCH